MVDTALAGPFFGIIITSILFTTILLTAWCRVEVSEWMAERLRRAPLAPWLGGRSAARSSTPGQYLFIAIVGAPVAALLGVKLLSVIWESPVPQVRAAAVVVTAGGMLLAVGVFAGVSGRVSSRKKQRWAGVGASVGGACAILIGILIAFG